MLSDFDYLNSLKQITNLSELDELKKAPLRPLDPEHFKLYIKSPSDIEPDTMSQLADLIDGKMHIEPPESAIISNAAPATIDRITNSITIMYIEYDGIPVGVLTLIDPDVENYQRIVPSSIYTMMSGFNLDGRLQQEFFVVADDFMNYAVAHEMVSHFSIDMDDTKVFAVIDETDENSIKLLYLNNYQYIATMDVDYNEVPIQLWVN